MATIKGAVVVIYRNNPNNEIEYLLLQHKNSFWTFVGGRIEDTDSSVVSGLQREILEELGLQPSDYELIDTKISNEFVYGNEKPDRAGKKGITYYYLGKLITTKEPKCHAEIVQFGWFNEKEILQHLAFEDIKSKFSEVISTSKFN